MSPRIVQKSVAIVFGTFNRKALLERAVASVRTRTGPHPYQIVVVDGGSTDGSLAWLAEQPDVHTIRQEGPLTGAVIAFNLGFGYAVDEGFDYVMHLNDDAELVRGSIAEAIGIMERDPKVGEVAFEFDLRGGWGFETVNGAIYANFGVIAREAGMAVARIQGDPTGRAWWNPIYRTYGADSEFGVWLWKLGYRVHPGIGLRVHDANELDELREKNLANDPDRPDSRLFWSRWRDEKLPPTTVPRGATTPPRLSRTAGARYSTTVPPRHLRAGRPIRRRR